jgi:hypothetical protein
LMGARRLGTFRRRRHYRAPRGRGSPGLGIGRFGLGWRGRRARDVRDVGAQFLRGLSKSQPGVVLQKGPLSTAISVVKTG